MCIRSTELLSHRYAFKAVKHHCWSNRNEICEHKRMKEKIRSSIYPKAQQLTLFLKTPVEGLIKVFFHHRVLEFLRLVHHESVVSLPRNHITESLFFSFVQDDVQLERKGRFRRLRYSSAASRFNHY